MGICLSVSSSDHNKNQIYNYNSESSHGHDNAVIFFDHENDHDDDQVTLHSLGSVFSKEGSKGINQDSAILYQGFGAKGRVMCGVFDGHGKNGHSASDMVKDRLPLLLLNQINNVKSKKIPENSEKRKEAITSAFRVMDKDIKRQQNLDFDCSGTTAVVAIRQEDDLILANLGDSRAVLGTIVENKMKAVQLTTDLKPGVPCEAERIRSCNGRVLALKHEPHIQRVWLPNENLPGLAMSRALGDFLLKDHGVIADPDVSSHRISAADQFIVLATDGIWDVMSNDDVAAAVWEAAEEGNEEAAARVVVEAAGEAWKRDFPNAKVDDCTVVCLFFHKKMNSNNNVVSVSKSL